MQDDLQVLITGWKRDSQRKEERQRRRNAFFVALPRLSYAFYTLMILCIIAILAWAFVGFWVILHSDAGEGTPFKNPFVQSLTVLNCVLLTAYIIVSYLCGRSEAWQKEQRESAARESLIFREYLRHGGVRTAGQLHLIWEIASSRLGTMRWNTDRRTAVIICAVSSIIGGIIVSFVIDQLLDIAMDFEGLAVMFFLLLVLATCIVWLALKACMRLEDMALSKGRRLTAVFLACLEGVLLAEGGIELVMSEKRPR